MSDTLSLGPVHHMALTVSNLERSSRFYSEVLGLQLLAEIGARRIYGNGQVMIGMGEPPGGSSEVMRFDESHVGLDHLSFGVPSRADLEAAIRVLDRHNVPHGDISDLTGLGLSILAFRDPDNIQLELTAPYQG